MERPFQDAAFAATVIDYVLDRLYNRLARAAAADDALRSAFGLPPDFAACVVAEAASRAAAVLPPPEPRTPPLPTLIEASDPGDTTRAGAVDAAAAAAPAEPRRATVRSMLETAVAAVGPRGARGTLPDRYASAAGEAAECRVLAHARAQNAFVNIIGVWRPLAARGGGVRGFLRRALVGVPFVILVRCFQEDAAVAFGVPRDQALQVALPYEV